MMSFAPDREYIFEKFTDCWHVVYARHSDRRGAIETYCTAIVRTPVAIATELDEDDVLCETCVARAVSEKLA